jgi:hypothetical protein
MRRCPHQETVAPPPVITDHRSRTIRRVLPVRNVTRTSYPHLAYGRDVCTEGDVAFDLEPVAAAQQRCESRLSPHPRYDSMGM